MPTITCPECGEDHSLNDTTWAKVAGKSVKCKSCGQSFEARVKSAPPPLKRAVDPPPAPEPLDPTVVTKRLVNHVVPDRSGLTNYVIASRQTMRLFLMLGPLVLVIGVLLRFTDSNGEWHRHSNGVILTGVAASVVLFFLVERMRRQIELLEIQMNMERLLVAIANNTTPKSDQR